MSSGWAARPVALGRAAGAERYSASAARSAAHVGGKAASTRLDMARAGAVGYIVKGAAPATIVDTIHSSAKF